VRRAASVARALDGCRLSRGAPPWIWKQEAFTWSGQRLETDGCAVGRVDDHPPEAVHCAAGALEVGGWVHMAALLRVVNSDERVRAAILAE